MEEITRVRALCCECGNLRTVSANYRPPCDVNRTDERDHQQRGWRCTATLKCSTCATKTRHAILRDGDDEHRDIAERLEKERISRKQLAWLSDDELRREGLRRIRNMLAELDPESLTLEECYDLGTLLSSMMKSRGLSL